eukprot:160015_1
MNLKTFGIKPLQRTDPVSGLPISVVARFCPTQGQPELEVDGKSVRYNRNTYPFEYVYKASVTNDELFDRDVRKILQTVDKGYNVSILAFGQSGSGKTHTMFGPTAESGRGTSQDPGIIFMSVAEILKMVDNRKNSDSKGSAVACNMQFFEIYNDVIHDLLTPSNRNLTAMDDGFGPTISGIT